jgi:hypothetical protein
VQLGDALSRDPQPDGITGVAAEGIHNVPGDEDHGQFPPEQPHKPLAETLDSQPAQDASDADVGADQQHLAARFRQL